MKMLRCACLMVLVSFLLCLQVDANFLINGDYEGTDPNDPNTLYNPTCDPNDPNSNCGPNGWTFVGQSGPQITDGWDLVTPEGSGNSSAYCVRMDNNGAAPGDQRPGMMQVTSQTFEAGATYSFTVDWFIRAGQGPRTWLGLELSYEDPCEVVIVASATIECNIQEPWDTETLEYTVPAASAAIGKPIMVTWRNRSHRDLDIDNAMLEIGPGARIVELDGSTDVDEEGPTSDTYTVELFAVPEETVTITATVGLADPNDPSSNQVTVDKGAGAAASVDLVFTTSDWDTPQTVTVKAVDDALGEGPHLSTITHTSASDDPGYVGITIFDVVANITDNDPYCGQWGYRVGDISGPESTPDCYVDLYDLAQLAADWLQCTDPTNPGECTP